MISALSQATVAARGDRQALRGALGPDHLSWIVRSLAAPRRHAGRDRPGHAEPGHRPARDPLFAALVKAGRELAARSGLVSLTRWATDAGVAAEVVKTRYVADAGRRRALEEAIGARCVYADGGCFLVKEPTSRPAPDAGAGRA